MADTIFHTDYGSRPPCLLITSGPSFSDRLLRRKPATDALDTNLKSNLTTRDSVLLNVGSMIGIGVYVLSSTVAKNAAGPSVVISFIISGLAAALAAFSYSELAFRYPKPGSAYSYTYMTLGEIWSFLVGWCLALDNVIAIAASARSCSAYIDSLAGGIIQRSSESLIGPIEISFASDHLDFLAFSIVLLFALFLTVEFKFTSYINNTITFANAAVLLLFVAVGSYFSNTDHWTNTHTSGFMPYGVSGMFGAAASVFCAFNCFDSIVSVGDGTQNPQKYVPLATMASMGVSTVCFVVVSIVLTLMVNYSEIAKNSGLSEAFAMNDAEWAKIIVSVGAILSMFTTLIATIHALTRIIFAMASDGLLLPFCGRINSKCKTPLGAMYTFSLLSSFFALFLDLETLIELISLGTLFSFIMVNVSVIVLRYRPLVENAKPDVYELTTINEDKVVETVPQDTAGQLRNSCRVIGNYIKLPAGSLVRMCVSFFAVSSFTLCCFITLASEFLRDQSWWAILLTIILILSVIASFVLIVLHQQSQHPLRFKTPLVPYLPALSIFLNNLLIVHLNALAWLILLFWQVIGLSIYLAYGIDRSKLETLKKNPFPNLTKATFDARNVIPRRNRPPPMLTSLSREQLFANIDTHLAH